MTTPAMLYNRALLDDDDDSEGEMTKSQRLTRRRTPRKITKTKSIRNVYKKHRKTSSSSSNTEKNKNLSLCSDSSLSQSDYGDEDDDDDSTDSSLLSYCLKNHRPSAKHTPLFEP